MLDTHATGPALPAPGNSPALAAETATLRRISLSASSLIGLKPSLNQNLVPAGAEDLAFERAASAIMQAAANLVGTEATYELATQGTAAGTEATYELATQGTAGTEATYELASQGTAGAEATYELAAQGTAAGTEESAYELASSNPSAHEYDTCRHDTSRETMMFDEVYPDGAEATYELGSLPFWFLAGSARQHVRRVGEALLKHGARGNFFVRDKRSHDSAVGEQPLAVLALNVVVAPDTLNCYQVEEARGRGWSLRGCYNETFPTVAALIKYYADEDREALGVRLVEADKTLFPDMDLPTATATATDATYDLAANTRA